MTDAAARQKMIDQLTRKRAKLAAELEELPADSRRAEDIRFDLEEIDETLAKSAARGSAGHPLIAAFNELTAQVAAFTQALIDDAGAKRLSARERERIEERAEGLRGERYQAALRARKALGENTPSEILLAIAERGGDDPLDQRKQAQGDLERALRRLEEADIEVARLGPVARAAQQRADDHRDRRSSSYDRLLRDADGARSALEFAQRNVRSELGTIRALRKALAAAGVQAVLTPEMEERLAASPSRED